MKYNLNPDAFSTHQLIKELVQSSTKVLDVGCAAGYFAGELGKKGCEVWGIDNDREYVTKAKQYCKETFVVDLENPEELQQLPQQFFDYILFMDVLEHLRNPQQVLEEVQKHLTPEGKIVISLPNSATLWLRLHLLGGNFEYAENGLLDKTHLKFFTHKTFTQLLRKADLRIVHFDYNADLGILQLVGRFLRILPRKLQYNITSLNPTLFATQFIFVCQKGKNDHE